MVRGKSMKIVDILKNKNSDVKNCPGATIAFLGDSVTQGCFELYKTGPESFAPVFEQNNAYHAKFKDILSLLYPAAPVSIINAGISGGLSSAGYERIERDIISHSPDLTVVCFGLNDCQKGIDGIEEYKSNLKNIFAALRENRIETIFMTPNMMNTNVSCHMTDELFIKFAENSAKIQLNGILDKYMDAAREVCSEENVRICDCYKIWKAFYNGGVDVTEILSNKLNHPIREMHWLFAHELLRTIFDV